MASSQPVLDATPASAFGHEVRSNATKPKPPASMSHVVLQTPAANFEGMKTYYLRWLNAYVSWENPMLAFLAYDAEHHRVAIFAMPGTQPAVPHTAGLAHLAFTFDSLRDLLDGYRSRKELYGIKPTWCVNHGPTTSMYYTDPDGNEIEAQVWNFGTPDEINAFLETPEFRENPIGVDFDPEDLLKRLDAGESERELVKRPNIGPRLMP